MPLRNITAKLGDLELRKAAGYVILIVGLLLILDVLVTVFGSYNLGRLGISIGILLSNLLFLEGSLIFALGTFIGVAIAVQRMKPSPEPLTKEEHASEETPRKRIHPTVIMIIVGIVLIALSIVVGTVFP